MAKKEFKTIKYQEKGVTWETSPDICKSCGLCILKCPVKCLSYDLDHNEYLGTPAVKCAVEKCIVCKTCENVCPECAIKVSGKR